MDEVGQILREARETRGLTLVEVQKDIRINRRYLEAMENGEYDVLPSPVHVRGFMRNYARYLNLDPEPLLERYELNRERQSTPSNQNGVTEQPLVETSLPVRDDQPFFDPVNYELENTRQRDPESLLRLVIVVAVVVFLILVANRFVPMLMGNGDGSEALTEGINEVWQGITNDENPGSIEPVEAEDAPPVEDSESSDTAVENTSRNDFSDVEVTPFPTRPPLPATMETIDLRLDIAGRTWMEVTIDGDVRFSGIAKRGDVFEWTAEEEAKVLTGDAINVIVTINGVEWGRMGERGENKEEVWRTTQ